ncbi:MAG: FAD-binding oxidoreductase [Pseudomonadota bacterium]
MQTRSGWGNNPRIQSRVFDLQDRKQLAGHIDSTDSLIAYGNGRSYGDSALWEDLVDTKRHKFFLAFDEEKGSLTVQAGCMLSDILQVFVPRGWFLKVSPGTKLITVGGAIASDVHGKNHHIEGCFSECVEELTLMQEQGKTVVCSRDQDPDLFRATCGGQGLTGIILEAKITLKRIESSSLSVCTYKTDSLQETFKIFEQQAQADYSVAWIDCLASGTALGRAHVSTGEFKTDQNLSYAPRRRLSLPFFLPRFVLNSLTVKVFNVLYYHRQLRTVKKSSASLDSFFYPLDSIAHWNRAYGKQGFVQYQVIFPLQHSYVGLQQVLGKIATAKKGSFLAVLKLHGEENDNYLSFPLKGYSLALDFKYEKSVFALLDDLDKVVVANGGRTYLAKDSRVSKEVFEQGYPAIKRFRALRQERNLQHKFRSLQSQRLEL